MLVFGEPSSGAHDRPAAYALVVMPRGVPLVEPKPGVLFLPGGGMEPGEDAVGAALRELREETGIQAVDGTVMEEAVQHFTAADGTAWCSRMAFVACTFIGFGNGTGEHPVRYLEGGAVPDGFAHEAHAWALGRFLNHNR